MSGKRRRLICLAGLAAAFLLGGVFATLLNLPDRWRGGSEISGADSGQLPEPPGQIPEEWELALDPEILALEGDADYGEYLSSECLSCHSTDGSDNGIPSITNWPAESFIIAMYAYKTKLRPSPVMQMIAARLSAEEIAALAAYFSDLD